MNAQLNPVPSALDAYREAARKRNEITRGSRELQERIGALEPLHERHAAAKAIFDRITSEEAAMITEWARAGGQGDAPRSDAKAVEKAAKALAEAERVLQGAGIAKADLERDLLALNEQIQPAQANVRHAQAAVIGEEWLVRCEAYAKAVAQLDADRVTLFLLFQEMHAANPGVAGHYTNTEHARETQRFNNPSNDPQAEGAAAFNRWYAETFKDEGASAA